MSFPARFDFEPSSPVEVKLLLIHCFLSKALVLASALPLNQSKPDQVDQVDVHRNLPPTHPAQSIDLHESTDNS